MNLQPTTILVCRTPCYLHRMQWLAGVDRCRTGWFRICRETTTGEPTFGVIESVEGFVTQSPWPELVALDMPIGLPAPVRVT
jgi:predicted RNase H-like nuclease